MRTLCLGFVLIICVLAVGVPQAGAAEMSTAGVKKALQTAVFHSRELAQRGTTVAGTQLHIQHVINCLEGPGGMHFKAAAGYPCVGTGNGIINDLKALDAAHVKGAHDALTEATIAWTLATQALEMKTVDEAQPWTLVVSRHLQAAFDDLGG